MRTTLIFYIDNLGLTRVALEIACTINCSGCFVSFEAFGDLSSLYYLEVLILCFGTLTNKVLVLAFMNSQCSFKIECLSVDFDGVFA